MTGERVSNFTLATDPLKPSTASPKVTLIFEMAAQKLSMASGREICFQCLSVAYPTAERL
jgi:hypothetical protein